VLALLLLPTVVFSGFEGASLDKAERLAENHLRCFVKGETGQDGRNRQPSWFYFRIDGAAGRDLTIDLAGLHGEYNYRPHDGAGHRTMHPVFSYDGKTWRHVRETEWLPGQATLRLRLRAEKPVLWIARTPPYTNQHLDRLVREVSTHPAFRIESIGASPQGRPIRLISVSDPRTPEPAKKVIWLMARQHAWESGTSWVAEGALRHLASKEGAGLRRAAVFKILPLADPDGVARGGVRFNAQGYDLNRNWDAADPDRTPEIWAQRQAILKWLGAGRKIDLFLTLHNTESAEYIEGPAAAFEALARRLWQALDSATVFHSPQGPRNAPATTTAGMKGRMTVSQALFHERGVPAFLMELMVDFHPRLKRWPTVQDRLDFGPALLRALLAAAAAAPDPAGQDPAPFAAHLSRGLNLQLK
jgi:hypothetical protein